MYISIGNSGVLTERLKQFENMATVQMKDIGVETKIVMFQTKCYGVHMVQQKQYEVLSSHEPIITAFGFSKEQMRELKNIIDYTKGGSFVNLLTKHGKNLEKSKNRKLSVNEVLTDVWEPAKKQWQNLYTKLKKGEMLFSEFEKNYLTQDLDELRVELSQFNKTPTNISWIDERIYQFKQYKTICACSEGAKAILNLVAEYNMKGSFRQIKEIDCLVSISLYYYFFFWKGGSLFIWYLVYLCSALCTLGFFVALHSVVVISLVILNRKFIKDFP